MLYTDIGETWQKLSLITGHARRDPDFQFTSLAHLLNNDYLRDCYNSLNRNRAVGIDNAKGQKRRVNTFDFLGFTHYCGISKKGKFKLSRKTSRKKYSVKCKEMDGSTQPKEENELGWF